MVEFDAELWLWEARTDSWVFVALPEDASDDILERTGDNTRGFGAVRVEVSVGRTTWRTSIFPSAERKAYVLPIKKSVRRSEKLEPGDTASITVELIN